MAVSAEPPSMSGLSPARSFAEPSPRTRRRRKGEEPLRSAILRAAGEVFASRGLAGASMDEVGEASGCGKRMLYYYFASKEALHREVVMAAHAAMNARWQGLRLETRPAADGLALFVGATFDFCLTHDVEVRLMADHALHVARRADDAGVIAALSAPTQALLKTITDAGAAAGVFRSGVDIADLHLSITALCMARGDRPGRRASVIHTVLSAMRPEVASISRSERSPI